MTNHPYTEIALLEGKLKATNSVINAYIENTIKYKQALHDAINSPKGVVPESAERLYDQEFYKK